jgi:hypothetical protein
LTGSTVLCGVVTACALFVAWAGAAKVVGALRVDHGSPQALPRATSGALGTLEVVIGATVVGANLIGTTVVATVMAGTIMGGTVMAGTAVDTGTMRAGAAAIGGLGCIFLAVSVVRSRRGSPSEPCGCLGRRHSEQTRYEGSRTSLRAALIATTGLGAAVWPATGPHRGALLVFAASVVIGLVALVWLSPDLPTRTACRRNPFVGPRRRRAMLEHHPTFDAVVAQEGPLHYRRHHRTKAVDHFVYARPGSTSTEVAFTVGCNPTKTGEVVGFAAEDLSSTTTPDPTRLPARAG